MFKHLLGAIGQYKKDSILAPLFVTFEVVMEVLIPLLIASLIDLGIDRGDMGAILKFGVALIFAALVSLILGVLSGHFAAKASAGFGRNLRRKMYYALQDFSFFNIDKFSTASLVTRLTTDVTNVQQSFQ